MKLHKRTFDDLNEPRPIFSPQKRLKILSPPPSSSSSTSVSPPQVTLSLSKVVMAGGTRKVEDTETESDEEDGKKKGLGRGKRGGGELRQYRRVSSGSLSSCSDASIQGSGKKEGGCREKVGCGGQVGETVKKDEARSGRKGDCKSSDGKGFGTGGDDQSELGTMSRQQLIAKVRALQCLVTGLERRAQQQQEQQQQIQKEEQRFHQQRQQQLEQHCICSCRINQSPPPAQHQSRERSLQAKMEMVTPECGLDTVAAVAASYAREQERTQRDNVGNAPNVGYGNYAYCQHPGTRVHRAKSEAVQIPSGTSQPIVNTKAEANLRRSASYQQQSGTMQPLNEGAQETGSRSALSIVPQNCVSSYQIEEWKKAKRRGPYKRKGGLPQLTQDQIKNILEMRKSGRPKESEKVHDENESRTERVKRLSRERVWRFRERQRIKAFLATQGEGQNGKVDLSIAALKALEMQGRLRKDA